MKQHLKEAIARFKAESPPFFKMIRKIGLYLAGVGVGLAAIPSMPLMPEGLDWIQSIGGYVAAFGTGVSVISTLPVADTNQ